MRVREQIVESAVVLLGERGFRGTRMADVARACGISESMVVRQFPTKATLLEAVLLRTDQLMRTQVAGIVQAAQKSSRYVDLLVNVGRAYAESVRGMHQYYVLWTMNRDLMPARTKELLDSLYPKLAEELAGMPDYRRQIEREIILRAFLGAVFAMVFLNERIGTSTPRGFSFEEYLSTVAGAVGTFLSTNDLM
jgi:AcrR family transcriptional regulator